MTIEIEGMHCDACVRRVSAALARTGIGSVNEVSVGRAQVEAPLDSAPMLIAALGKAGFAARVQS